jgi:protein-tyrosine-phosphatase
VPPTSKYRILFVCIGNACRSPMAEAIARHHASDVLDASSAGLYALGRVAELTEQTLLANGYALDGIASKPVAREALNDADLIINLAGAPRDRIFGSLANVEDWDVEDPYGQDPCTYQRILEEIESRVLSLANRLRSHPPETAI